MVCCRCVYFLDVYIYGLGGLGVAVACGVVVTHSPCVQHFLLSYSPKYLAPCRTVVYVLQCVCVPVT